MERALKRFTVILFLAGLLAALVHPLIAAGGGAIDYTGPSAGGGGGSVNSVSAGDGISVQGTTDPIVSLNGPLQVGGNLFSYYDTLNFVGFTISRSGDVTTVTNAVSVTGSNISGDGSAGNPLTVSGTTSLAIQAGGSAFASGIDTVNYVGGELSRSSNVLTVTNKISPTYPLLGTGTEADPLYLIADAASLIGKPSGSAGVATFIYPTAPLSINGAGSLILSAFALGNGGTTFDISGTTANPTVTGIQGIPVRHRGGPNDDGTTSPLPLATGQVLALSGRLGLLNGQALQFEPTFPVTVQNNGTDVGTGHTLNFTNPSAASVTDGVFSVTFPGSGGGSTSLNIQQGGAAFATGIDTLNLNGLTLSKSSSTLTVTNAVSTTSPLSGDGSAASPLDATLGEGITDSSGIALDMLTQHGGSDWARTAKLNFIGGTLGRSGGVVSFTNNVSSAAPLTGDGTAGSPLDLSISTGLEENGGSLRAALVIASPLTGTGGATALDLLLNAPLVDSTGVSLDYVANGLTLDGSSRLTIRTGSGLALGNGLEANINVASPLSGNGAGTPIDIGLNVPLVDSGGNVSETYDGDKFTLNGSNQLDIRLGDSATLVEENGGLGVRVTTASPNSGNGTPSSPIDTTLVVPLVDSSGISLTYDDKFTLDGSSRLDLRLGSSNTLREENGGLGSLFLTQDESTPATSSNTLNVSGAQVALSVASEVATVSHTPTTFLNSSGNPIGSFPYVRLGDNITPSFPLPDVIELDVTATGGSSVDVQTFTADGTWTKPASLGANSWVQVVLIGGGGGGGSGRKGTGADRGGGAGGAGGGLLEAWVRASELGATETVDVGAGGGGGAAQSTNSTNGNAGTAGSETTFDVYRVAGGTAGPGGTTSTASGGSGVVASADGVANSTSGSGGTGQVSTGTSAQNPNNHRVPKGGGGGGGVSAASATAAGGSGGSGATTAGYAGFSTPAAGGTAGTNPAGAGGNGNSESRVGWGGTGGGGGGGGLAAAGGDGGDGGNYGGGGGGGGAGTDSVGNSGAGGDGASGYAIIISYP